MLERGIPARKRAVRACTAWVVAAMAGVSGCVYDWNMFRAPRDAGRDDVVDVASTDAAEEAGLDVPTMDAIEVGSDAPADVREAGTDVLVEAGPDAPPDVPTDVPMDAGGRCPPSVDASPDVPADGAACTPVLRINEVQVAGAAGAADEFVEIYNAGPCDVSLANWTLRYASASGTTVSTRWTGAAGDWIPAGGYVLVAGTGFPCSALGQFAGTTGVLAGSGGGIGLYPPGAMTPMDSVGYGPATNPLVEGMPAALPDTGQSIARIPNGNDTNNNRSDFQVRTTPTPGAAN